MLVLHIIHIFFIGNFYARADNEFTDLVKTLAKERFEIINK